MTPLEPKGPNAEQIKFWNTAGVTYYIAHKDAFQAERLPLTRRLVECAAPGEGERTLDVGCGYGATTMQLARRVGRNGCAVGIDLSDHMLQDARQSARTKGLQNVSFENADAQVHPFKEGEFDLVVSLFGVMFFADPVEAFRNIRTSLQPSGRIAFLCWQLRERSECLSIPLNVVTRFTAEVLPPPPPGTPGQFGFADRGFIAKVLDSAGFTDIGIEDMRVKLPIGGGLGLDDAAKWFVNVAFPVTLARVNAELRPQIEDAMREALRPFGISMTC